MLGHKISLNKFKKIKIVSSIFSNHNGMKLEINYKKKIHIYMKIKQHATVQPMLQRRNEEKFKKKHLEKTENGNTAYQNL